jgi:molybdopterin synthase sulfur carrier subunit
MMKIKIVLFASLRETLDSDGFDFEVAVGSTVASVVGALGAGRGEMWARVLGEDNVLTAINHTMVNAPQVLVAGDELAFFPPVTGG